MIQVRLIGKETAEKYLNEMRLSAILLGTMRLQVGSDLPYSYGIEVGHHRNGTLARRAGGAFYLRDGWAAVRPTVGSRLARALPSGPAAVKKEMMKIGDDTVEIARFFVPKVSHDLERSIKRAFRSA